MSYLTARTTQELQAKIVEQADGETLILTPGRRLARRLRHTFRMAQMERGRRAWIPPKIVSFNAWLTERWHESWPEEYIISDIARLCLWKEAVQETPPPGGIEPDIRLYRILDETYSAIVRHKIPGMPNGCLPPLMAWRQKVMEIFKDRLRAKKCIHPAFLPIIIKDNLKSGVYIPPKNILCVGFESPAPVESELLACLAKDYGAKTCYTESKEPPSLKAISLPDREQEAIWLVQDVLEKAQDTPLHRIGVVIPDMSTYAPLISRTFKELIGSPTVQDRGSYNISLGDSLLNQPLVQAALLPLRFRLEDEKRILFLSLLLSPYYGLWNQHRDALAQADDLWRRYSIDQGLSDLLYILRRENPEIFSIIHPPGHDIADLLRSLSKKQTGTKWVEALHTLWDIVQFPVITDEQEERILSRLQESLVVLARDLGKEKIDAYTFYAWLKHLLSETKVNIPGYEEAGIQVIGLIESRGLSFDFLYVAGLSDGSLPQPVRYFPLLTTEEKGLVQGATVESQYLFAKQAFARLMAVAPAVILTRPREEKGNPLPPSPYWPEKEEATSVNYWLEPRPASLRADWLRQAQEGWQKYPLSYPPKDKPILPAPLPEVLSATAVEKAISCPFKFFVETVLGLTPLEEPAIGILPREKGNRLHNLLALFTSRMRRQGISLFDENQTGTILKECIIQILTDVLDNPYWQIEKKRWLELLDTWLSWEKQRAEEGWCWLIEEADFGSLHRASWPFTIRGRIDRIDFKARESRICCWDYKTGRPPSARDIWAHFIAPQLPLYLMALQDGKIPLPVTFTTLTAGYIELKSTGEVQLTESVKDETDWGAYLSAWEKEIADLGQRLVAGDFPADPKPVPKTNQNGSCQYCSFATLCTYWKEEKESGHA